LLGGSTSIGGTQFVHTVREGLNLVIEDDMESMLFPLMKTSKTANFDKCCIKLIFVPCG